MSEEKLSKYLSYLLRHHPEDANLTMDENGWVDIVELLNNTNGKFSMAILTRIVETDEKKRYSFDTNRTKIRANQGHSIDVNPDLEKKTPPDILYHGTAERSFDSIMKTGIMHQTRRYVHLSKDYDTALKVGLRHGDAIVLELDTKTMSKDGIDFYISENGVWMTEYVDPKYIVLGDYITVVKKIDKSKYNLD